MVKVEPRGNFTNFQIKRPYNLGLSGVLIISQRSTGRPTHTLGFFPQTETDTSPLVVEFDDDTRTRTSTCPRWDCCEQTLETLY